MGKNASKHGRFSDIGAPFVTDWRFCVFARVPLKAIVNSVSSRPELISNFGP